MGSRGTSILTVFLVTIFMMGIAQPAHALDKRLKLMFKTAGYGAAAGAVIGAGTMLMGMGGFKNVLMGASSGMYAGILLAAYIVATPPEKEPPRSRNPYPRRKPVGPDEWENEPNDDEDNERYIRKRPEDEGALNALPRNPYLAQAPLEKGAWAPLVSLHF